jgi:hypothetical protein
MRRRYSEGTKEVKPGVDEEEGIRRCTVLRAASHFSATSRSLAVEVKACLLPVLVLPRLQFLDFFFGGDSKSGEGKDRCPYGNRR